MPAETCASAWDLNGCSLSISWSSWSAFKTSSQFLFIYAVCPSVYIPKRHPCILCSYICTALSAANVCVRASYSRHQLGTPRSETFAENLWKKLVKRESIHEHIIPSKTWGTNLKELIFTWPWPWYIYIYIHIHTYTYINTHTHTTYVLTLVHT